MSKIIRCLDTTVNECKVFVIGLSVILSLIVAEVYSIDSVVSLSIVAGVICLLLIAAIVAVLWLLE